MEQTTTMWEIRGDGGSSDKLMFIDTGGAEVLSLAQDSNATFGGWVYVNNRVMGASGDIRVGSNDGNEMLHLLAAGTAKIDTAGTTALSIDANQNVVIEDGSLTSKKSFYVTNDAPQIFLTDTDTSRYGSIYYGTRAYIFDNVMNNEALDSVDPWFEWRFATAESGTYTSMMKIERNAYTFNEAYTVNFTNTGSNSNVNINAGGGSARLYLDAANSSGEYGELWFQAAGNTVAGIQGSNSGILRFMTNGSSESMQIDQHGTVVIQEHKTDPDSSKMLMKSTKNYTDDEYENFTLVGTSSLIIVSDTTSNDGGVFFASYNSSNVTLIADPQSEFAAGDTDGRICCFKNGGSSTFQVKNRRGYSKDISVAVIGCGS